MDIPTATVSEANGEISCSVEETNRIRAALGLKPLSTGGGADGGSGKVEVDARVDRAQLRQQEELRDRIERARLERLRSQESSARGLGDVLKAGALSAADWVALSRQKDAADKAHGKTGSSGVAASRAAPRGHGGSGATGVDADLVVSHSADDFAAGEAAVLTLRDRGLLDGDDLADGTDELVNVDRAERERAAALQERRKRAKLPVYDGLDDEEFDEGAGGGSGSRMLRQYDGEEGDDLVPAAIRAGGGLVIKAGGTVEDIAAQRRDGARRAAAGGRAADDVSGARGSSTVVSDFYTPSELAAQRAARGGKKPRSMRKAVVADADDAPAAAGRPQPSAGGVLSEIAASGEQEPSERDRGSRANRGGGAVALQAAEEAKRMAVAAAKFDSAVARATEQSAALLSDSATNAELAAGAPIAEESARAAIPAAGVPPAPTAAAPSNLNAATKQRVYSRLRDSGALEGGDDDDAELAAVLARARRMAQAKAAAAAASAEGGSNAQPVSGGGSAADRAASYVARAVTASRHQQQQESAADASAAAAAAPADAPEDGGSDGEGGGSGGAMVFNSITEFSHLLQARVSEQADAVASAAEEGQATTAASAAAAATAPRAEGVAGVKRRRTDDARSSDPHIVEGSTWVDEAGEAQGGRGDDDDDGGDGTDDDDEEEEEGFGRDANLGRGAAGALSLFARGGALHAKTAFVGRSKDARLDYTAADTLIAEGPAAGHQVVLEYKDEHGNLLTSKQAYRELCYRFHGRKPSQKTRDKRMRQNSREQRLAHAPTADTPLGSLSALQRAQEARGAAGLVMSHGR